MVTVLRRLGADMLLILVWVGATAFSFGFWSYCTQPETYILSMPAIVLGINIVIGLADDRFSPWSLAVLGSLMAFATLINQMHVVLVVTTAAAAVLIWYRRRPEIPMKQLLLGLASFASASGLVIGAAYFGASIFVLHHNCLGKTFSWSKGYASTILLDRLGRLRSQCGPAPKNGVIPKSLPAQDLRQKISARKIASYVSAIAVWI